MGNGLKIDMEMESVDESGFSCFRSSLQAAFAKGFRENFGMESDGLIPSDEEVDQSLHAPGAEVWRFVSDGSLVGGAVVTVGTVNRHASLDLFFVTAAAQGRGMGSLAWQEIEAHYPDVLVWETFTPYVEKRNIYFYLHKCGFSIVDFYCRAHSACCEGGDLKGMAEEEMFRFQKKRFSSNG